MKDDREIERLAQRIIEQEQRLRRLLEQELRAETAPATTGGSRQEIEACLRERVERLDRLLRDLESGQAKQAKP